MLANVTIRNGFPLRATFDVVPADPDVGLFGGVEVHDVATTRGRSADFLKLTADEWDDIARQCAESLCTEVW